MVEGVSKCFVCLGVSVFISMCLRKFITVWVYLYVSWFAEVCLGVSGCVLVSLGVAGCVWVCLGVSGCV